MLSHRLFAFFSHLNFNVRVAGTILVISFIVAAAIAIFIFLVRPHDSRDDTGRTAATGNFGVFRSDDGGQNWKSISSTQGGGSLLRHEIGKLIAYPHQADTFFAITANNGLYRTENKGEEWVFLQDESNVITDRTRVNDIAFDQREPQRWYLVAFIENAGRLLRTEDNGKHFGQTFAAPVPKVDIAAVAVDQNDARTVYIGLTDGLLLQSQDFGISWKTLYQFRGPVKQIAVTPTSSQNIFVVLGSKQGLWKSADYGENFKNITPSQFSGGQDIQILTIDPSNGRRFFLGTAFGLLESQDGGDTFAASPLVILPRSLPVGAVALDARSQSRFFVGAGNGFYETRDGGEHWIQRHLPTSRRIGSLVVDRDNPDVIYAGLKK